jgi:hypothetical protein
MGRQWNAIIDALSGGTMSINANLTDIEALLTTLQADIADDIGVSSVGVVNAIADGGGNVFGIDRDFPINGSVVVSSGTTSVSSGTISANLRDESGNGITSTTSGGKRRLDVMLASAGTTGSATPNTANLYAGTDGTNLRAISVDTSGRLNVSNQSIVATVGTLSGTSALNADLIPSTDVTAYQEVLVQVTGTWPTGASIQHQVSNDNVNFGTIVASNANASSGGLSSTVTATGSYKVLLSGFAYYRLRVTVAGSAGTYSYAYSLNPRSSVFNTSVSVSSAPVTTVQLSPTASFGYTTYHTLISAATTNATNVKASAVAITVIRLTNTTITTKYFKIFNLAVAPTMGTSTPILNYAIEPNSSQNIDFGTYPMRLATGFSYAITGGQALLDTTAVGAGDVVVNVAYA